MLLRSRLHSIASLSNTYTRYRQLSTVSAEEIAFFSKLSSEWWDAQGEFKLLHRMNRSRSQFLRSRVEGDVPLHATQPDFLSGKSVLDVGCGGGLFSEVCLSLIAREQSDGVYEASCSSGRPS